MFKNRKGQLSIINIIYWIVLVIVSIVVTPIARGFINEAISQTNNTMEILVLNGILPIYWLVLIGVIVFYAVPIAGEVQY